MLCSLTQYIRLLFHVYIISTLTIVLIVYSTSLSLGNGTGKPMGISCIPTPIPVLPVPMTHSGLTIKKISKISQNGQALRELWSKHPQFTVLIITQSILNCFGSFLVHFAAHR